MYPKVLHRRSILARSLQSVFLVLLLALAGCTGSEFPVRPAATATHLPQVESAPASPTALPDAEGLSGDQIATLSSLRQVADHPLYTMRYVGSTADVAEISRSTGGPATTWACSLFAALGDPEQIVYGRNFDWEHSPALLLFMDPQDGYGSVSMVDIAYLGFRGQEAQGLTDLPLEDLEPLLQAHRLPFDGMNDQGLVVGMAAVPDGGVAEDPAKPTIGSLAAIRRMLDTASTADQAVEVLARHNIDFGGGPDIHYLIADSSGRAVLAELAEGELQVTPSSNRYHLATNFLVAPVLDKARGRCGRYDRIADRLSWSEGKLDGGAALNLLADVAQDSTQWSVVYGISGGTIDVAMGRQWDQVYQFRLD